MFWSAFFHLSNSRPVGMDGAGRIPVSEIANYCWMCGFNDPVFHVELLFMVQEMDDEWMMIQAEKRPKG